MNCHSQRKASFVKKKGGKKRIFIDGAIYHVHCMYTVCTLYVHAACSKMYVHYITCVGLPVLQWPE